MKISLQVNESFWIWGIKLIDQVNNWNALELFDNEEVTVEYELVWLKRLYPEIFHQQL